MEKLKSALVTLLVAALCVGGLYWSLRPGGGSDIPGTDEGTAEEAWSPEELALLQRFLEDVGVTFGENEQYIIEYTSNGDGTCAVTDILLNPLNRKEIALVIPETSPDGDAVVSIATTLASPDFGVPPIVSKERFEAVRTAVDGAFGMNSEKSGELARFYTLYDLDAVEPWEELGFLMGCPLLNETPCYLLDGSIYVPERMELARILWLSGAFDTVDYLSTYYELYDLAGGREDEIYLEGLWSVRNALKDPSLVRSVELPDSVLEIADRAFMGCRDLRRVRLSENLRSVPKEAFRGAGLLEITFPDNVQAIGENAFNGCFSLTRAELGVGLRDIAPNAFWCPKLVEIRNYSDIIVEKTSSGSGGYGGIADYARWIYVDTFEESRIIEEDGCLFYASAGDDEYFLLDYFGDRKTVALPLEVSGHTYEIYDYAFYGEVGLESVELGNGVSAVSSGAFTDCVTLKEILFGETVEVIEEGAFSSCTGIENYYVEGGNPYFDGMEGVLYTEGCERLVLYPSGRSEGHFTVPDGVREVAETAFRGAICLSRVELPYSVESTSIYAFYDKAAGHYLEVVYRGTQEEWLGVALGGMPALGYHDAIVVYCSDGELYFRP